MLDDFLRVRILIALILQRRLATDHSLNDLFTWVVDRIRTDDTFDVIVIHI